MLAELKTITTIARSAWIARLWGLAYIETSLDYDV